MVRERFPSSLKAKNVSYVRHLSPMYYHDLITEKSWQILQELKRKYQFILIGGWAVYLYTHGLKSKDIDLICDYSELEKFKSENELFKNDRLKKYEIHLGEVDIDMYIPFYSDLGIPVEDIQKHTRTVEGFIVPSPEILLILKQKAFNERKGSHKGEKDKFDIISLLQMPFDFQEYKAFISYFKLDHYAQDLKQIFSQTSEAEELGLNKHQFSRLKENIIHEL